jgi:thiamine-phosphate pyrophosphorylase
LFELPHIYPITDTRISGLSHAEQVERLIAGGASLIQLREKYASSGHFYDAALEALDVARPYSVKIIINDRVDVALAVGADGVHLGQNDLPPNEARSLLGPDAIIGFSTHTDSQLRAAAGMPVDYAAIGPIFGTTTKDAPDPVVGIDRLRSLRGIVKDLPLVAIGGIDDTNINEVFGAGADSAAVISCLLRDPDRISEEFTALDRLSTIV